ncbi:MAG: hypothetical protein GEV06_04525 [Luteitalea sp.]|nr:hypothetical protein [Luteitalea sp.]
MSRTLASAVVTLLLLAAPASALTLAEIIELSKTGVSEEVLVALIEVDGTAWDLTPQQVVELTEAGVSERVLLAIIDSGRGRPVPIAEEPLAPEEPVYDAPQVTIVPAAPQPAPSPEELFYVDAPGTAIVVEQYETLVPVPVFVDLPDQRQKRHPHRAPPDSKVRSIDERPRHARDDASQQHGDRPGRRGELPKERWARDLPRPGIPASEQPRYRDHSRDLGARDLRALQRAHLDKSSNDRSSSDAARSRSDSDSDRKPGSRRPR